MPHPRAIPAKHTETIRGWCIAIPRGRVLNANTAKHRFARKLVGYFLTRKNAKKFISENKIPPGHSVRRIIITASWTTTND